MKTIKKTASLKSKKAIEKDTQSASKNASDYNEKVVNDNLEDPALEDEEPIIELEDGLSDDDPLLLDTANEVDDYSKQGIIPYVSHVPERTKDSLHLYLHEINRFSMLQPEEEIELTKKVKLTGDPDAAFRLVSSHLRLVVRIAMNFQRRWMQNVLDLIQEGNIGLVRAVSKFDPEKGIKFSYYATFWIKAYILKFIMDNWRLVKIGTTQTQRKLFYNLNKERQQLIAQGYNPDAAVLAERLNVTKDQIIEMEQRLDSSDMSLDAPVGEEDGGGRTRLDYIPALGSGIEEVLSDKEISNLVRDKLTSLASQLSSKEKYILENRLLTDEPVTLREIGDFFSITRERVRQIEARLLQKVRDHLVKNIKDFSRDWIEQ